MKKENSKNVKKTVKKYMKNNKSKNVKNHMEKNENMVKVILFSLAAPLILAILILAIIGFFLREDPKIEENRLEDKNTKAKEETTLTSIIDGVRQEENKTEAEEKNETEAQEKNETEAQEKNETETTNSGVNKFWLYIGLLILLGIAIFFISVSGSCFRKIKKKEKKKKIPNGNIYWQLASPLYVQNGYDKIFEKNILPDVLGYSEEELKQIKLNNGTKWVQQIDEKTNDFPVGSTILYGLLIDERFDDGAKKTRLLTLKNNQNVRNVVICKFRIGYEYDNFFRNSLCWEIKTLPFMVNKSNPNDKEISLSQNCENISRQTKTQLIKGYNKSLDDLEKVIENNLMQMR